MRPGLNCASATAEVATSIDRERCAHGAGAPMRLARDDQRQREEQQRRPDDARRQLRRAPGRGAASACRSAPRAAASISRDQCDTSGSGAPMRGSVVSNQGAPPSSSRTVTRRTASSVSPSQSESDGPGPASVAMTRKRSRQQRQARAAWRPPAERRPSAAAPCAKPALDIAAAPSSTRDRSSLRAAALGARKRGECAALAAA